MIVGLGALPKLASDHPTADCEHRLKITLEIMLAGPLLKEEQATGLMWLRMDAQEALERGDEEKCAMLVSVAELLLGITEPDGR